ncbi:hypothetical protein [Nocardia cyriacigeorgica]|uniref:hypothetical protein n=1 Tax=Nocardia cyriacigeorgica TaxID=135487 RepID=UPI002453DD93|nr:hypothetical protein [Nocardia cyriacigeorgica]
MAPHVSGVASSAVDYGDEFGATPWAPAAAELDATFVGLDATTQSHDARTQRTSRGWPARFE